MMKTESSALKAAPARAARVGQALWVWRLSGEIGHWLPEAMLGALGHERPAVEPFAEPDKHAALARSWRAEATRELDEKRLRAFLTDVNGLVHTVDRWSEAFHRAMSDVGAQRTGRHLIVYVRDAATRFADRLALSPTRPAADALVKQDRLAMARLGRVRVALGCGGVPVHVAALEDLAAGDGRGDAAWRELLAFVDKPTLDASVVRGWRERLMGDVAKVVAGLDPRWKELLKREALWAGGAELNPACLKAVEKVPPAKGSPMRLVRFDRMPAVLREGEAVRLSGVVVPRGPLQADRRLFVRHGARRQRLGWDQPSPSVATQLPSEPSAGQARFKPLVIHVTRRQPVAVLYRPDKEAAPVPVGEIAFQPIDREEIEGIFLARWSIGYQPIPKVACTSIKELLFRSVTGHPFSAALGEGADHVHRYFDLRTRDVSAAAFRFTVVRDPIKRFLSAFSNRVLHHKELSRAYVERLKLDPALDLEAFHFDPDLARFVDHFDHYRRVPTIDHHFRPISEFTAPLAAFDKVYPFEALDDLAAELQRRIGVPMSLPHSQRGGPKLQVKDLSPRVFNKLVEIFAADYKMLEGLYSPSALR